MARRDHFVTRRAVLKAGAVLTAAVALPVLRSSNGLALTESIAWSVFLEAEGWTGDSASMSVGVVAGLSQGRAEVSGLLADSTKVAYTPAPAFPEGLRLLLRGGRVRSVSWAEESVLEVSALPEATVHGVVVDLTTVYPAKYPDGSFIVVADSLADGTPYERVEPAASESDMPSRIIDISLKDSSTGETVGELTLELPSGGVIPNDKVASVDGRP
jgi:hypothetical protein